MIADDDCRFCERLVMMVFATYLIEYPFWQGYLVVCLCIVILLLHFTYVPAACDRFSVLTI